MQKKRKNRSYVPTEKFSKVFDDGLRKYEQSTNQSSFTSRVSFTIELSKSLYSPSSFQNPQLGTISSFYRERLYNRKNISKYRSQIKPKEENFKIPEKSTLNNISMTKSLDITQRDENIFKVAGKKTLNQIIRKKIRDFQGQQRSLSNSIYQWHNKSGLGVKTSTQYQISLRNGYHIRKPGAKISQSQTSAVPYQEVLENGYDIDQLICPRQKKLFKLKA